MAKPPETVEFDISPSHKMLFISTASAMDFSPSNKKRTHAQQTLICLKEITKILKKRCKGAKVLQLQIAIAGSGVRLDAEPVIKAYFGSDSVACSWTVSADLPDDQAMTVATIAGKS